MQKTFKIGESAIGGIIKINKLGKGAFKVECLDYYTKEVVRWSYIYSTEHLFDYIEQVSTHYYADKITNHFKNETLQDI